MADVAAFQRCFTGAGGNASLDCTGFDVDACGPVDLDDFAALLTALTGP